jgi:sensor domain CHASE-containing protein
MPIKLKLIIVLFDINSYFQGEKFMYPNRRADALATVNYRNNYLTGPFNLVQGYSGMFARLAVFVQNVDRNETFGQPFDIMDFDCEICYNEVKREKVWGIVTSILHWDSLKVSVVDLETIHNYRYRLSSISS